MQCNVYGNLPFNESTVSHSGWPTWGWNWFLLFFSYWQVNFSKVKLNNSCQMPIFTGLASTVDDQKYEILGKYELKAGSLSKTVRSRLKVKDGCFLWQLLRMWPWPPATVLRCNVPKSAARLLVELSMYRWKKARHTLLSLQIFYENSVRSSNFAQV